MARDAYEYDVGGLLQDREGRDQWVAVEKHASADLRRGYEPVDADGRREVVILSGTTGANILDIESDTAGIVSTARFHAFTNPVQEAIDAASASEVVEVSQDYVLPATLTFSGPGPLKIRGRGNVTVDYSTAPKIGGIRYGLRAAGSVGVALNLTANATRGPYSVTLSPADAATLAAGDWVQLGTDGAGFYPYPGYNIDRGEIKQVRSVVGGTVNFKTAVYDDYLTANAGFLRKIDFVENVTIDGVTFRGPGVANDGSRAIDLAYVNGFRIKNCDIEATDIYCIGLHSCIRGEITGNTINGVFYDGVTGTIFYGVYVGECSQWIRVHHNHAEEVRHLYTNSSLGEGQGYWGQPRFIEVDGNMMVNAQGGDAGRSWAFSHHGVGDHVNIHHNIIDGCYAGLSCRGPGLTFAHNEIHNWYQYGIQFGDQLVEARDICIEHNIIGERSLEGGGATTPKAIFGDLTNATTVQDVSVSHNKITSRDIASQIIHIAGGIAGNRTVVVHDNRITCLGTAPTSWVIEVYVTFAVITKNIVNGSPIGIRARATDQLIKDNELHYPPANLNTGEGVFSALARTRIINNTTTGLFKCVRLAAGGTDNTVKDNVGSKSSSSSNSTFFDCAAELATVIKSGNRIDGAGGLLSVVSVAAMTLPSCDSPVYLISGSVSITSITAKSPGSVATLKFSGTHATGVVDGSNLKLSANFPFTPDDTLTLMCDGTDWAEMARSTN